MRNTCSTAILLLAMGVMGFTAPVAGVSAQASPEPVRRWEYRVLTREQLLELGKKDLTVGLNQLGTQGWELVAVDAAYIFKRPADRKQSTPAEVKYRLSVAESDLEMWRDRASWSERMFRKGFLSQNKFDADKAALKSAEIAVERARKELEPFLLPEPKQVPEKDAKPDK